MPTVGRHDVFESSYRNRLKALLAPHGQLVEYAEDRATLDLGLHLYTSEHGGNARISNVRVWFQCKGIQSKSLSAADIRAVKEIRVGNLPVDHVQFWYGSPEPVYLCVYLEAIDAFIAQDVRDLVDAVGGMAGLKTREKAGQKTMTLNLATAASLETALAAMPRHRSLRIDGPSFRGRPLGHRYDPLRSILAAPSADDFSEIVHALLNAHEFKRERDVPLGRAFGGHIGSVSAVLGTLNLTYEWTSPLETEFGVGEGTDFQIESPPRHAQGRVLVVVHSDVLAAPKSTAETAAIIEGLAGEGITEKLVFFNAPEGKSEILGAWMHALGTLGHFPQGLGSLAFNLLTATNVYLDFMDRLEWSLVNYM